MLHTSPENIIHIGYWRVNEPAAESGSADDAALAIEWFAEDDTSLDTYEYTIDHVIEHGLEGSPTFVFHTTDPAAEDSRSAGYLPSIRCLRARRSPRAGCSATCISSTPTICTRSSPRMRPPASRPCANPRWYATMCANEGTVEDRCAIIRALHHLQ